jgi:hypothetical protein
MSRSDAARTVVCIVTFAVLVSACRTEPVVDVTAESTKDTRLHPILEEGHWGYMNHEGHLSIAPEFDAAWPFSEGRALVQRGRMFGYIDVDGEVVIPLRYRDAWYFSNGLAPVLMDTTWSFIDRDGVVVVSRIFDVDLDSEDSGVESVELDRVRIDGRYGFKNAAGQIVIDPQFDQAWNFIDGLARVQVKGKWGFIDRTGKLVIEPEFDVAWDFEDGLARVKVGDKFGYVNTDGEYVWAPTS